MNRFSLLIIALVMLGGGLLSRSQPADGAFHIMRVWEVMGGAYGNSQVQYVELRMPVGGQNFIAGHQMCFFDAGGIWRVRMSFTASAANGPIGVHSILMGSSEFDAAWAAGNSDFTFGGAGSTMTSNGGDVNHPIQAPGGKVGFGDYDASCVPTGAFGVIDSVAYGTVGLVTADAGLGTKLNADLPITGTQAIKYKDSIPLCHPFGGACPRDNNADYSLVDANTPAGNNPRNNVPLSGPVGAVVPTGDDYYETQAPGTSQDFAANPIPADFFDPQSDPFSGVVQLDGAPIGPPGTLGTADTIVRRLDRIELPMPFPASDTVPIEIVALNLVSVNPITVTYIGGPPPETWNVAVSLNPGPTSGGTMTATGTNASGGTFDSTFQVFPRFTFTRVSDSSTRILDYPQNTMQFTGAPWRYGCPSGSGVLIGPLSSSNFCGSVNDTMRVQTDWAAPAAAQRVLPACGDQDADLVNNCVPDNCPNDANPLQENNDLDSLGDVCDDDDDNDTVLDVTDNCDFDSNPNQGNHDGDGFGDVCDTDDDNDGILDVTDTDDDNDGVTDVAEGQCEGTTPSSLRPERIDGVFAGVDDDGIPPGSIDEALPGGAAGFDCDGDGYTGTAEDHVFFPTTASDQDPCGGTFSPPTSPNQGWPANIIGGGATANDVDIQDLSSYVVPTRRLNTSPGDEPAYNVRWDLIPGAGVQTEHINIQDLSNMFFVAPPMLGGPKAYNGPMCPWP